MGPSGWILYDPFIFLDHVADLEPRTETDAGGSSELNPNRLSVDPVEKCMQADFTLVRSDERAGKIVSAFNPTDERFFMDFDSIPVENSNCDKGKNSGIGFENLEDADWDGTPDQCQHIFPARHRLFGNVPAEVRRRVRNVFFDATNPSDTGTPTPPTFQYVGELTFGGKTTSTLVFQTPTRYGESLGFTTPADLTAAGDLTMILDPNDTDRQEGWAQTYRVTDMLFASSRTLESAVVGVDLRSESRMDLYSDTDELEAVEAGPGTIRGLASRVLAKKVYAAISERIVGFDPLNQAKIDFDGGTPEVDDLEVGEHVYGVDVEPDDQYVHFVAGDPDQTPGTGWFGTIDTVGDLVIADPNNPASILFGSISGVPIDVRVRNLGDTGSRESIGYVTSVVISSGICDGDGAGAMGSEPASPMGGDNPIVPCDPDGGPCGGGGGGGGAVRRQVLVSAFNLERPDFLNPVQLSTMELSCNLDGPDLIEDIGVDIAADGRIFVASPDTESLVVVPTGTDGALEIGSESVYPLAWRPAAVAVAKGAISDLGGDRIEMALVVGEEQQTANGMIRIYPDTGDMNSFMELSLGTSIEPVAVAIRDDGEMAYVVQEGAATIARISLRDLETLDPAIRPGGQLRCLTVQRTGVD
jgi:hypothetical protein